MKTTDPGESAARETGTAFSQLETPLRDGRLLVLAASVGGHLGQALRVRRDLSIPSVVVTTEASRKTIGNDTQFLPMPQGLSGWFRNIIQSIVIASRLRPALVVGFGSRGVAVFCVISRMLGSRLVLVESFARTRTPSKFVRWLRPFAQRVLVQWPGLLPTLAGATLVSPIYRLRRPVLGQIRTVLVSTGTYRHGMNRLLRLVDDCIPFPGGPKVVCQIGDSSYIPRKAEWFRYRRADEFLRTIQDADILVTHDGASILGQALELAKPTIVVSRSAGELDYAPTHELVSELESQGWIVVADSSEDLSSAMKKAGDLRPAPLRSQDSVSEVLRTEYALTVERRRSRARQRGS